MTAIAEAAVLTEPGVYEIPEAIYHGDPVPGGSLSSSGAKRLLPPSCPARFRYEQDHPVVKDIFDFGSAAHKLVLGVGPDLAVINARNWQTNKAKDERDAARAFGQIPVLADDYEQVKEMAAAIRQHPIAGALFDPDRGGKAEQSLFWPDHEFGIWRRARLDWMPDPNATGRFILGDYKTCVAADKASVAKAVANYGYYMQDAWYIDAVAALGLADDAAFLFVFQEKNPPYLITVAELDYAAIAAGREANRMAMEIYRDCKEIDRWPGYGDDIELISLPAWMRGRYSRGDF